MQPLQPATMSLRSFLLSSVPGLSLRCTCNSPRPLRPPRLHRKFANSASASPSSFSPSSSSASSPSSAASSSPRPRPSGAPFQSGYWTAERRRLLKVLTLSFPCMVASGVIIYQRCRQTHTHTHAYTHTYTEQTTGRGSSEKAQLHWLTQSPLRSLCVPLRWFCVW